MRFARPWHHEQTVAATHDAALDVAAAEHQAAAQNHAHTVVELDTEQLRQLSAVFSSPRWLRDLGIAAWLLVGVAALLVGLTWILGLTSTIVEPVLVGLVVATVASPAVSWLHRHRVPRAAGAALMLLLLMRSGRRDRAARRRRRQVRVRRHLDSGERGRRQVPELARRISA